MSPRRDVMGQWMSAHQRCCKITFSILFVLASASLIGGIILVRLNGGSWDSDKESFDEAMSKSVHYVLGCFLIALSAFLFISALISGCCVWQIGLATRAMRSNGTELGGYSQPGAFMPTQPYPPLDPSLRQSTQPYPTAHIYSQQFANSQVPTAPHQSAAPNQSMPGMPPSYNEVTASEPPAEKPIY